MKIFFISTFLLFVLCLSIIIPLQYDDNTKNNVYLLKKDISIENAIKSQKFELTKKLIFDIYTTFNKNLWLKIPYHNSTDRTINKTVLFFWTNVSLDMYYVRNGTFKYKTTLGQKNGNNILFDDFSLNKNESVDIYIKVINTQKLDALKYFNIVNTSIMA